MSGSPPAPSAFESLMQDAVMKRRLMIDGDGMGDERKIMNLMRLFLSFCSETNTGELAIMEKKLSSHVTQVEHSIRKTVRTIDVNEESSRMYDKLDEKVKEEVEKTREEIEKSKILLEQAKEHRKHLTEYSALASIIRGQPDRKETEKKRIALENELANLQKNKDELDSRLDQRKRSMHVLMTAIRGIEDMINEEENEAKLAEERANNAAKAKVALVPSTSTAGSIVPMETDDLVTPQTSQERLVVVGYQTPKNIKPGSSPGSPLEQITPDSHAPAESRAVSGTVSSMPGSPTPMETEKSEKYDDLSESE